MSDAVLTVLKFCLLALLYLFLLRVVWIVARELRGTPAAQFVPAPAPVAPAAPRKAKRDWKLVVVTPASESGRAFPILNDATVGRGGGCTIPLTFDTFVSTVHARVSDRDGQLWVEDVGSTNGTIVNGKTIDKPTQLRKGDRVKVGETTLEVDR